MTTCRVRSGLVAGRAVGLAGLTMPEKSTYFFPKLQTGLVFHLLDPTPDA